MVDAPGKAPRRTIIGIVALKELPTIGARRRRIARQREPVGGRCNRHRCRWRGLCRCTTAIGTVARCGSRPSSRLLIVEGRRPNISPALGRGAMTLRRRRIVCVHEPVAARCLSTLGANHQQRSNAQAARHGNPSAMLEVAAHSDITDQGRENNRLLPRSLPICDAEARTSPTAGRILTGQRIASFLCRIVLKRCCKGWPSAAGDRFR